MEPVRQDYVERLSHAFAQIGVWSYDHRGWVLALCLALGIASAFGASRARFDNSFEAYFDTSDPTYVAYRNFRGDFGTDEVSYIVYEAPQAPHGPFDLAVMRKIAHLTELLEEEVPFVRQVTSLANAEYVEGVADGLEIHDLLEEFPETQQELLAIRDEVLAKPLYVGGLVSPDASTAAILVEMDRSSVDPLEELRLDPEAGDALSNLYPQVSYHAIESILARPEFQGIVFHHVGDVPLNAVYNEVVASESGWLGGVSLLVIASLLFAFFRRPMGVIGPLLVVALSVLVSVGLVGWLGWTLDLFFIMLPTLLIAVGVADSVHIIAEFRAHHVELGDRREAARRTMSLVGTPCLLTSLTTAAGFASLSTAPIESIAHFALYSAAGVMVAFLLSVTLLLALLSFGRRRLPAEAGSGELARAKGGRLFQATLASVARFDIRHRRAILVVFGAFFAVSALGIARLRVDSNFMTEFSEQEPVRRATAYVDEVMGGTYSLVYLVDSGAPEGIKDPEFLRDVQRLQAQADARDQVVRKSYSIADLLQDINESFHADDPAYYRLPETRELAAQYLLVYEMSGGEELYDYVSRDFERASLELRCRTTPTSVLGQTVAELDAYLDEHPIEGASVTATGIGALWLQLQEYITRSQIRGFLLAFSVIAFLLCVVFRSIRTGLIAMVPNLSPVVLTLGAMGWLDVPLDYVRLFIASVAIGISVDDTIHHVIRFRHEFRRMGSYERALLASMADVGRALVITSLVLVIGFLTFALSRLDTYVVFGSLLATTILSALLSDFLLMPALVATLRPWGREAAGPARSVAAPLERSHLPGSP